MRVGLDIGSTTIKCVVLNDAGQIVYSTYERHFSHILEKGRALLEKVAAEYLPDGRAYLAISGSAGMGMAESVKAPFVQEVFATRVAANRLAPGTDVIIELGGEDAKILFLTNGLEVRMNGSCAGGTGAFIDQMAAFIGTDAAGLDRLAQGHATIYPIASRCGVFAKTDILPLLNEGCAREDIAASIMQAVVNQTIGGLARGRAIKGKIVFLGGPLSFLPSLRERFTAMLKEMREAVFPEDGHFFVALGAAYHAMDMSPQTFSFADCLTVLEERGAAQTYGRLPPLFASREEREAFAARHSGSRAVRRDLATSEGDAWLGFDCGSTTIKAALLDADGNLLYSFYDSNKGDPLTAALGVLRDIYSQKRPGLTIRAAAATGYGSALLAAALRLDVDEVETVAHFTAARFFEPRVSFILDIGGQDIKCMRIRNGVIDRINLNEACSAGCGSFIENFAESLNMPLADFVDHALRAASPVDLGTRCTVFMNSNVKQAQKEGATVQDISAGLAYSVIKNALYKVIKLADPADLGRHIVVQGGTFYNQAVLRAFEKIAGVEATCPDISGIMGAFGAALVARERYHGQESTTLPLNDILSLTYTTSTTRCGGCSNRCMLTINKFPGGRRHVTGNRCEKGLGGTGTGRKGPNVTAYKLKRMFDYPPLENPSRGVIGIPRVLNMYENYPFWATFFRELGFRVVLSPKSNRKIYELGMESIPSESECYPAKLSHGHVQWLINEGIKTIFHPCVFYEHQETPGAQNHYNCPIVVSYPENLKNNVEAVADGEVRYIRPFLAFTSEKIAADRLAALCKEEWGIDGKEVRAAVHKAWEEQQRAKSDVRAEGQKALQWMADNHARGIVLAGRPYHIDPEINHGIPEMIASYDLAVLTEDSLPIDFTPERPLRVNDQWVYHSRLYSAAEFVRNREDLELIQLNSFGCGLDAVTTDQVCEILEGSNKLYTVLKIDEVNNLGAARIRIRSLLAAMNQRQARGIRPQPKPAAYHRSEFTKEMYQSGYTILAPQMSPIHFDLLEPIFKKYGYHIKVLANDNRAAIDMGLKFVNNDACFPSITVVGQIMDAVLSGKYDTDKLAVMMTQTGGCCRASNYVGFIRRALDKAGLGHIPVISLNANGMETNEGFKLSPGLLFTALRGVVYGDLFMRCLYRVRPYEKEKGSANALHQKWLEIAIDSLVNSKSKWSYKAVCSGIVEAFDALPIDETLRKPRVGVVGEILVKYMPLANNHLVDLLEAEGAEAVVPDLMDFLNYCVYNGDYKHEFLGAGWTSAATAKLGVDAIRLIRKPALDALEKSRRFEPPMPIEKVAELAKPFLSIGNQYGEGWFLTGEMAELVLSGTPNIVCIQPFACLPNHVVGKGVIKALKKAYPQSNIVAVDYDPGASEVNQLNRIKLMLSTAKKRLAEEEAAAV